MKPRIFLDGPDADRFSRDGQRRALANSVALGAVIVALLFGLVGASCGGVLP